MCLAGTMVALWFLTKEMAGSSTFNDKNPLLLNSINSVKTQLGNISLYH